MVEYPRSTIAHSAFDEEVLVVPQMAVTTGPVAKLSAGMCASLLYMYRPLYGPTPAPAIAAAVAVAGTVLQYSAVGLSGPEYSHPSTPH